MGKGSGRRNEDAQKVRGNWDTIFGKKPKDVVQEDLFKEKKETNDDKK